MSEIMMLLLGNAALATAAALLLTLLLRWTSLAPRLESLLWLGIALRFLLPPLIPVPAALDTESALPALVALPTFVRASGPGVTGGPGTEEPGEGVGEPTAIAETGRASQPAPHHVHPFTALQLGVLIWIVGIPGVLALRLARRRAWLSSIDLGPAPIELAAEASEVGRKMGVRGVVIMVSRTLETPAVVGLVYPRILWPERFLTTVDRARTRTLIAHEVAHLKHRDLWSSAAELVVGAVWWWYPGWHWVQRRYREASERACDACVVRHFPEFRRDYAEALLDAIPALPHPPLTLSRGLGGHERIRRRLTAILQPSNSGSARGGWVSSSLLLLALAPAWLASMPVDAERTGATTSSPVTSQPALEAAPSPEPTPALPSQSVVEAESRSVRGEQASGALAAQDVPDPGLVDRLRSSDPDVRRRAVGDTGRQRIYWAMPWVYPLVTDPSASVRSQVAASIGIAEPADGISVLLELVGDGSIGVRRHTAWALGEYEADRLLAGGALPALIALSEDPDAEVRRRAGASLARTEIEGSTPTLISMLKDSSASARRTAVWGLGDLRTEDVTRRLLPLAADPDPGVRKDVARALWLLPSEAWRETVELLAIDPYPAVRATGGMALRQLAES